MSDGQFSASISSGSICLSGLPSRAPARCICCTRLAARDFPWSPAANEPTLSLALQRIALPAETVRPTLAFFYKAVSGDPHGISKMQVNIADANDWTATVYTGTAGAEWT